jgi:hypothetical protein
LEVGVVSLDRAGVVSRRPEHGNVEWFPGVSGSRRGCRARDLRRASSEEAGKTVGPTEGSTGERKSAAKCVWEDPITPFGRSVGERPCLGGSQDMAVRERRGGKGVSIFGMVT